VAQCKAETFTYPPALVIVSAAKDLLFPPLSPSSPAPENCHPERSPKGAVEGPAVAFAVAVVVALAFAVASLVVIPEGNLLLFLL